MRGISGAYAAGLIIMVVTSSFALLSALSISSSQLYQARESSLKLEVERGMERVEGYVDGSGITAKNVGGVDVKLAYVLYEENGSRKAVKVDESLKVGEEKRIPLSIPSSPAYVVTSRGNVFTLYDLRESSISSSYSPNSFILSSNDGRSYVYDVDKAVLYSPLGYFPTEFGKYRKQTLAEPILISPNGDRFELFDVYGGLLYGIPYGDLPLSNESELVNVLDKTGIIFDTEGGGVIALNLNSAMYQGYDYYLLKWKSNGLSLVESYDFGPLGSSSHYPFITFNGSHIIELAVKAQRDSYYRVISIFESRLEVVKEGAFYLSSSQFPLFPYYGSKNALEYTQALSVGSEVVLVTMDSEDYRLYVSVLNTSTGEAYGVKTNIDTGGLMPGLAIIPPKYLVIFTRTNGYVKVEKVYSVDLDSLSIVAERSWPITDFKTVPGFWRPIYSDYKVWPGAEVDYVFCIGGLKDYMGLYIKDQKLCITTYRGVEVFDYTLTKVGEVAASKPVKQAHFNGQSWIFLVWREDGNLDIEEVPP